MLVLTGFLIGLIIYELLNTFEGIISNDIIYNIIDIIRCQACLTFWSVLIIHILNNYTVLNSIEFAAISYLIIKYTKGNVK